MSQEFDHRVSGRVAGWDTVPTLGTRSTVTAMVDRQLRLLVVVLVLVSVPSSVISYYTQPPAVSSSTPTWANEYYTEMRSTQTNYNARVDDLYRVRVWGLDLRRAAAVLADERVNVYVTDASGRTAAYSFDFDDDVTIHDLRQGPRSDATVRVTVDRSTIERIDSEYTQTRAVREAYLDGEIQITGVGTGNWLRWWLIDNWARYEIHP